MRRVYDDTMYDTAKYDIMQAFNLCQPKKISRYSYGMHRASASLIKQEVLRILNANGNKFAFGKVEHAHGIGNNNASEIIYLGNPNEQQICGLIHTNEDMYSGCYCYVTDIDGNRKSSVIMLRGEG